MLHGIGEALHECHVGGCPHLCEYGQEAVLGDASVAVDKEKELEQVEATGGAKNVIALLE